jgi:hypothetical protein
VDTYEQDAGLVRHCGFSLGDGGAAAFEQDDVAPHTIVLADAFTDADLAEPAPAVLPSRVT